MTAWLADNAVALLALALSGLALVRQRRRTRLDVGTGTLSEPQPDGSVSLTPYLRVTVTNEHKPVSVTGIRLEYVGRMPQGERLTTRPLPVPWLLQGGGPEAANAVAVLGLPQLLQDSLPVTWYLVPQATKGLRDFVGGMVHLRVRVELSSGRAMRTRPMWVRVVPVVHHPDQP